MCQLKGAQLDQPCLKPVATLGKRALTGFLPVAKKVYTPASQSTEEIINDENQPLTQAETVTSNIPVTKPKPRMSLIQAARVGDLDVIKELIELGEDINQDVVGCTALHYAVFYNRKEVIEFLIASGANLNATNPSGLTPLAWAVERGYADLAWMLLEAEADPAIGDKTNGLTPLHKATKLKNYEMVDTLLSINTEENEWCKVDAQTKDGSTAAYFAAYQGSVDILKLLIECGANVNALTTEGKVSLLHRAAAGNQIEAVKVLLENHANINHADSLGRTALYHAAVGGFMDIVKLLVENKAKIINDINSQSPIQRAQQKKFTEIAEFLTQYANTLA
jgi:ankyrin repeat protein